MSISGNKAKYKERMLKPVSHPKSPSLRKGKKKEKKDMHQTLRFLFSELSFLSFTFVIYQCVRVCMMRALS
jgi:hypothetical protein